MPNRIRTILAAPLALLFALVVGLGSAAAATYITAAEDGADTTVSGCVIRFSENAPTIHANGAHRCAGVESVHITDLGSIEVIQTIKDPGANPIIFAIAQGDETWAARGLIVGASGGTADTEYYVYDSRINRQLDLSNPADYDRIQGKWSNIWLGWFHVQK